MRIKTLEEATVYYDVEYEVDETKLSNEERTKIKIINKYCKDDLEFLRRILERAGTVVSSESRGEGSHFRVLEVTDTIFKSSKPIK